MLHHALANGLYNEW